MIDINTIVTYAQSELSYPIEITQDTLPNIAEIRTIPAIFMQYATVDSQFPNLPLERTIFNTQGENLVQTFEFHIVCDINNLRSIWVELYQKFIGWYPIESEKYHTGFTYRQGGKMGLVGNRILWVDLWNVGFPTNTILMT